jgi:hypothetical protein
MIAEGEKASRPMHPESNREALPTELPEGSRTHGEESGQSLDGLFGLDQPAIRIMLDAFLRLLPIIASRPWMPHRVEADGGGDVAVASGIM